MPGEGWHDWSRRQAAALVFGAVFLREQAAPQDSVYMDLYDDYLEPA
jgi:hypothetical protein